MDHSMHHLHSNSIMPDRTVKEPPTVIYSEDCQEQMEKLFSVCAKMPPPPQPPPDRQYIQLQQQQRSQSRRIDSNIRSMAAGSGNSSYVQTLPNPLNRPRMISNHFKTTSLPCQTSHNTGHPYQHPHHQAEVQSQATQSTSFQPLDPFHTIRGSRMPASVQNNPMENIKWSMHVNEMQRMEQERRAMLNRQNGLIQAGLYCPGAMSAHHHNPTNIFSSNLSEHCQSSTDSGLDSNEFSISSQHEQFYPSIFDTNNNNLFDNSATIELTSAGFGPNTGDYLPSYQQIVSDSNSKNVYLESNFGNNLSFAVDYYTEMDESNLVTADPFIHPGSGGEYFCIENSTTPALTTTSSVPLASSSSPLSSASSSSSSTMTSTPPTVTTSSSIFKTPSLSSNHQHQSPTNEPFFKTPVLIGALPSMPTNRSCTRPVTVADCNAPPNVTNFTNAM